MTSTPSWWPSWSASPPRGRRALPELREATAGDIPALLEVFFAAMEDLDTRRGRSLQPRNAAPLEMHFEHLLSTDPRSCWVAEDHGHVVAFGILMCRGGDAFLSFLFVTPRWQSRRLGRALLEACLRAAGPVARLSTCAEADQPVSTGLYASLGMAPRTPLYLLRGTLKESDMPRLPATMRRVPLDAAAAAAVDRELLGYERPQDHALWRRDRQAALFLDETGAVAGYGYAQPSGRVGPVAARDPALLPGLVGSLFAITPVLEGRQLLVPGQALEILRPLLAAGARIDGTPAVYCSSGAGPRFDRYLPMSFALL